MTPRLKHNTELAEKVCQTLDVHARYPKVSEQADKFPLEPNRLVRFGYNPTILKESDQNLLLAYRFHDGNTLSTRLALAQIGMDGAMLSNRVIDGPPEVSMEDPKLFWWQDQPWLLWVESNYPKMPIKAVVKWGPLKDGVLGEVFTANPPEPQQIEKNWVPFPLTDETLVFIYRSWPTQIMFSWRKGQGLKPFCENPGLRWPWGAPRGGSIPEPYKNGKLIRFFHSGSDNETGPWRRRYFVGAMLMHDHPPFSPCAISRKPILCGSELDDITDDQREKCNHLKPQVVFPGGAVYHDQHWLLAVGINDSQCAIMKLKEEQLNL